jgi:outer membrane translocation and assembly module TamA
MAWRLGDGPHVVVAISCALFALSSTSCYRVPPNKAVIASVDIAGPSDADVDALAERIATRASQRFLGLFPGVFYEYETLDRFALRRDLGRIERYLRARGFYDAQVRAARVVPDEEKVRVTIEVDVGAVTSVGSVRVEGAEGLEPATRDAVLAAARGALPLEAPFTEESYEAAETAVLRAMTVRGHARGSVTKRAEVDVATHTASVVLAVVPGDAVRLGPITFVGLGDLPEDAVRRVFGAREGEPYSSEELDRSRAALLDLGVFSSVEIDASTAAKSAAGAVPVTVRCVPAKLRALLAGGGLQIDQRATEVHGLIGWQNANFLGGLRKLDVRFKPGVVLFPMRLPEFQAPAHPLYQHRILATLRQPALFERRTTGLLHAEYNVYPVLFPGTLASDDVPGYHEIRSEVGLERSFGRLLVSPQYGIQANYPLSYLGTTTLDSLLVSHVELTAYLDLRDDPVRTNHGFYASAQLQKAGAFLGGDADDVRLQPEVRGYLPLPKKLVFAVRASVGLLYPSSYGEAAKYRARNPDQALPNDLDRDAQLLFLRGFYSGGPSSNRGYPVRGVGPTARVSRSSPAGQSIAAASCPENARVCTLPLGGQTLWEANAEVRVPVAGAFSTAFFCDAGDVSPLPTNLRFTHPHLSCGAGARYDTPVGPIRMDVGGRVTAPRTGVEQDPGDIFGAPIAIGIGIGEAF